MSQFSFTGQTFFYRGKVRDVYSIRDKWLVMVASDRISAFDVILPRPIPFKGQVLNQVAAYMLNATRDICPNWLIDTPAPHISLGRKCEPIRIEMVVRGYLAGHAARTYAAGDRQLCGVELPGGLKENDRLPHPIITPSTKAEQGHDEDISKEEIIRQGLVSEEDWRTLEGYALSLYARGQELAKKRGLILVDTKYEFGRIGDEIVLMDEIHTPDSSRYFYAEEYEEIQRSGGKQKQLSKEFVREWLIENDFMGKEGQTLPPMSDDWIKTISKRYVELYERVTGLEFQPVTLTDEEVFERVETALKKIRT